MATDNTVTLVGNVTRDPELRFTASGQAVATFGLAVNRRWQNRQTNEWEEEVSFFDVICWRAAGRERGESLTKGTRVIVTGRLEQRSWETQDGEKRSKVEIVADEIGPSLRWATAQVTKNERRDGRTAAAPVAVAAAAARAAPYRRTRVLRRRRGAVLMAKQPQRGKNKDNARRAKKKISILTQEQVDYVDYKDVNLLRRFMSDRAKIRARRVTGNDSQQQREIAAAIKNAREMALLPYTSRVTTAAGGRAVATAASDAGRWPAVRDRACRRRRGDAGDVDDDHRVRRPDRPRSSDAARRSRLMKVVLRSDVDGVGKQGRHRRGGRRLRPQLPRAQGLGHQGHGRGRGAGRADAPVA